MGPQSRSRTMPGARRASCAHRRQGIAAERLALLRCVSAVRLAMRLWTACALALAAWLGPAAGQLTITSTLAASPAPATPADGLTLTVTSVSAPALSSVPTPTPSPEAEPVTLTQTLTTPSPAGTDYITRTIFSTIAPAGEPPRVVTQVTVVVPNAGAPATQTVVQVSNCAATQCQDLGCVRQDCRPLGRLHRV